jgi:lysophospholipase L1-like esterase
MNLIFLGDSLMQQNDATTFPQEGWPQELSEHLANPKTCFIRNFARNGRSTKSFMDEGFFAEALSVAEAGDVAFISFGHNDEKAQDPARYCPAETTYKSNLALMAKAFQDKGVSVYFITSMTRLKYDADGKLLHTHGDYPSAMIAEGKALGIPVFDLETLSYQALAPYPFTHNERYYMCLPPAVYPNYPEGEEDTSHLRKEGAQFVVGLLLPSFKKESRLKPLFV